MIAEAEY